MKGTVFTSFVVAAEVNAARREVAAVEVLGVIVLAAAVALDRRAPAAR